MIPLQASEADFQRAVMDLMRLRGWTFAHIRAMPNSRGRWSVPYEGDPGLPDIIAARDGEVLGVELKRHGEHPSPQQRRWLTALGFHGRLWTPTHMHSGEIQEVLR